MASSSAGPQYGRASPSQDGDNTGDEESSAVSSHSPSSYPTKATSNYTTAEETAVLQKLDRNLTLFLTLLYLLSFLDRSNIGNARIAGLTSSLNLSSSQFSWLLTAFYITYILFEPLILLYSLVPAHAYIAICVAGWGVVASLQAVTTSFPQMLILRGLLGITEAAFGPGVPFYMTFFYKRHELATRVGWQISAAPLGTAFAGAMAWAIVWLNERLSSGWDSWRVLFLVEGFPSVLVGVLAWYRIPGSPGQARWLSPRERRIAVLRLKDERSGPILSNTAATEKSATILTRRERLFQFLYDVRTTLADPKCYLTALMFFSVNVSFASLPVFLPTVINAMSFSALTSQALAAPPYLCAFFFVLSIGRASDRRRDSRSIFLMACAAMSSVSYITIAVVGWIFPVTSDVGVWLRYAAVYPAAMGLFGSVVLVITWTLNNQQSTAGKGTAMTVLNLLGQCGPLVGVRLFPDGERPGYVKGMGVCGAFMAGVVMLAGGLRWWLGRMNARALKGDVDGGGEEVEMQERLIGGEEGGVGRREEDETGGGVGTSRVAVERFRFML